MRYYYKYYKLKKFYFDKNRKVNYGKKLNFQSKTFKFEVVRNSN